jgi:peptidoglycan/xylan/chitin deacetylase (PgdA/CDA1 family)
MSDPVTQLLKSLDRWARAGRTATFWLRDDDAVEPTAALDRLLELSAEYALPVTLAVIPEATGLRLTERLRDCPLVDVAVHGWSHRNYAGAGEKKQELGPHRAETVVLDELQTGLHKLAALYPERLVPVLVPPWNRISDPLKSHLARIGFRALSVFGPEKGASIPAINTHADIMDWHGTRGGRPLEAVVPEIVRRLDVNWEQGGTMGLLTHHLVHDAAAWSLIEILVKATAGHEGCRWRLLRDLLPDR